MTNKTPQARTSTKAEKKHPYFSGLTAIFGAVSIAGIMNNSISAITDYITTAGLSTAPLLCAATTAIAAISVFEKKRSYLSKAFNVASTFIGASAMYSFAENISNADSIVAFMAVSSIPLIGMTATGTLNTVAHYTRNKGWGAPTPDQS